MASKIILLTAFFILLQFDLIFSQNKPCGEHDVKINYVRNCAEPKNPHIIIHNLTYTVTDDCVLIPRGCFELKKPINSALVEYYVIKPPFKKQGSEELCKFLENSEVKKGLEHYKNIPNKCSLQAGNYCFVSGTSKIEEMNSKTLNFLLGTTVGTLKIESDGGKAKSCIEFKLKVSKKGN